MKLKKIADNLSGVKDIDGKVNFEITGIACDSKAVKPGYLFAALKGSKANGVDFIDEAIDRGATCILLDADNKVEFMRGDTFIYAKDARLAFSEVCRAYFGDVSAKMRLAAVTGTNGKTTITYLIESMFKSANQGIGVIGTVNYRFGSRSIPALNTTPGVLDLYSLLSNMLKEKIKACVMEVSSHSLEQGRVETLEFDAAIFTNLTREHLDFHKNMRDYLKAKLKLFQKIKKKGFAIINIDDPVAPKIIEKVKSEGKAQIITYGIDNKSDVSAGNIELSREGLKFKIFFSTSLEEYSSSESAAGGRVEKCIEIKSSLIGRHNVYNILAAIAAGLTLGMSLKDIKKGIESLESLPGRLEKIDCGQDFSVYVDYAHTEDGLEKVLRSLRELKPARLISVFGCGGNRDRGKRPIMGRISTELSDFVVITSDNPRNEEPVDIINEIIKGINKGKDNYAVEPDRFIAIKKALGEARRGDIVLLAGKGHETYQIFKDTTLPFDDREAARKLLREKNSNSVRADTVAKRASPVENHL
ncbi:MAG: UDP-N-acetylmuramoyl-L-alanyl-D-glutamate--2,6-diaminopimelate ligase [Candidatus Omnitrophota bacterium]|nr:UDP-N-acetylmuramoyl-L-alanyl-D-glutamate--2,6-diaminopimelate ligase [Candidatus Omnitrophota bacterium]